MSVYNRLSKWTVRHARKIHASNEQVDKEQEEVTVVTMAHAIIDPAGDMNVFDIVQYYAHTATRRDQYESK